MQRHGETYKTARNVTPPTFTSSPPVATRRATRWWDGSLINGDRQEDIGGIAGGLPLVTHHVALVLDLRRGEVAVESLVVLELLGIPLSSFTRNLGAC